MNLVFDRNQFNGDMAVLDEQLISSTSDVTQSGNAFPGFPRVVRDIHALLAPSKMFAETRAFVRRRDVGYKLSEDERFKSLDPHRWIAPVDTPLSAGLTEVRTALVVFSGVPADNYMSGSKGLVDFGVSLVMRYQMDTLVVAYGAHTYVCSNFAFCSDSRFAVGYRHGLTYAQLLETIRNWALAAEENATRISSSVVSMMNRMIDEPHKQLTHFTGKMLCAAVDDANATGLGIQDVSGFARSVVQNVKPDTPAVSLWTVLNWGTEQLHPSRIAPNRWIDSHSAFTKAVVAEFGDDSMKW